MIPLTDKEMESNSCQDYWLIYRKKLKQEDVYDKTYRKVRDIFIRQVNTEVLHMAYVI